MGTGADAVFAAKLRDRRASLMLLQNADDLLVGETVALHSLVLSMGQSDFKVERFNGARSGDVNEKGPKQVVGRRSFRWFSLLI